MSVIDFQKFSKKSKECQFSDIIIEEIKQSIDLATFILDERAVKDVDVNTLFHSLELIIAYYLRNVEISSRNEILDNIRTSIELFIEMGMN